MLDGVEGIIYVADDVRNFIPDVCHKVWDVLDDGEDILRVMEHVLGFVEDTVDDAGISPA